MKNIFLSLIKKLPLSDNVIKRLRHLKLIEGRKPNLYVSALVASATASKAEYIHTRAQDDDYYIKLICDYLIKFNSAARKDITKLLWNKLSDALDPKQKETKIGNLLTTMRNSGKIHNIGSRKASRWKLVGK